MYGRQSTLRWLTMWVFLRLPRFIRLYAFIRSPSFVQSCAINSKAIIYYNHLFVLHFGIHFRIYEHNICCLVKHVQFDKGSSHFKPTLSFKTTFVLEWYIFDVCRYKLIVPCLGCL